MIPRGLVGRSSLPGSQRLLRIALFDQLTALAHSAAVNPKVLLAPLSISPHWSLEMCEAAQSKPRLHVVLLSEDLK